MPKVRIKTPSVEIELEGEEDFLLNQGQELLSQLREYEREFGGSQQRTIPTSPEIRSAPLPGGARVQREGTVNTLVAKLGGSSCRQVLIAAAAHLTLFQGKERFTDEEWEATARTANAWKSKYTNQKATQKKRLIDAGTVIENASGVYSLSSSALADAEEKLA